MNRIILFTALLTAAGCGNKVETAVNNDNKTVSDRESIVTISEIIATGIVEPEGTILQLAAPSGGIVTEIYRHEGDKLKKGEPVAMIDNELEKIKTEQLRKQVESVEIQTRIEEIALAETEVRLKNKAALLESSKRLAAGGSEPLQNIEDLQAEVDALRLSAEKQRLSVSVSRLKYVELQHQLGYSVAEAQKKILRAPSDGVLLDLSVRPGNSVTQYSVYALMSPAGSLIVRAEVDELFADRLKEGQKVTVRLPGSSRVIAEGEIYYVSPYLQRKSLFSGQTGEQEDRLVRGVKIHLNGEPPLIINSKVECAVQI